MGAFALGLLCVLATAAGERPKMAVLPAQLEAKAASRLPVGILDDAVLTAVADLGRYDVIGQDDIEAMINLEQQKDLLGGDDASCFAEIGGALGVAYLMSIRVGLVDGEWVVTSKVIDIQAGRALHRATDTRAQSRVRRARGGEVGGQRGRHRPRGHRLPVEPRG